MKEAREFEAATEEEAVRAAARELGVNEEDLEYELAEPPSKGILGMGTRPARIVVMVEASEEPDSGGEELGEPSLKREVLDFQTRIIRAMQLELTAEAETTEEHLKLELVGPDRDIVLQSRAELLEAFQYLLNRTFSRSLGGLRILVDCDGFRRKKE
jgi:spoIIIJ-associated protein